MSGDRVGPGRPAPPGKVLYPMFVDLHGRRCLVVGGGPIAEERVAKLIDHGAVVRLVSPQTTSGLTRMIAEGSIAEHAQRTYRPEDLEGCFLVIAATNLGEINRMVRQDAEARDMLCNLVGAPALCVFVVPAVVRRGELAFAITTGGASPVVTTRIRRQLEEAYGPEWEGLTGLLRDLRDDLKARHPEMAGRRAAVEALMDSDVLRLLADGDEAGAADLARRVLDLGVHA